MDLMDLDIRLVRCPSKIIKHFHSRDFTISYMKHLMWGRHKMEIPFVMNDGFQSIRKSSVRGALMFSLMLVSMSCCTNSQIANGRRRYGSHVTSLLCVIERYPAHLAVKTALQWRHNERDGVSNHQSKDCLLYRLFRRRSKKKIKAPRHWPLWGEFIGDRWIPRTKGQWHGKCFHLMKSSWASANTNAIRVTSHMSHFGGVSNVCSKAYRS